MSLIGILSKGAGARPLTVCVAAVLCFSLAACEQGEKTRKMIDQRGQEAQQSLDSARTLQQTRNVDYNPLTVSNKVWGGKTALRRQHGLPLPTNFESPRGVTLVSADPMSLSDIANAISAQTGIPVRMIAMSVSGGPAAAVGGRPGAAGARRTLSPATGVGSGVGGAPSPVMSSSADDSQGMPVTYEGPLSGLLERVGAYFGVSWRYDGATIAVSRYETRIFSVEALPGTQEVREGMKDDENSNNNSSGSSSSSSSSSGGTSNSQNTLTQNSKFNIDFKYWEELVQVLNTIVGGEGNVVVSPSIGTVTVTTTPDVMATVADYLGKENKRLSRQIAINVQIYSVSLEQSEDFSVAFTGFLKKLSMFSGASYTSAAAPTVANSALTSSSFGSLSVAILNGENDPTVHAGDVFKALSSLGDTTTVAQFPMITLNNRPVSRRIGTDTAYVSSVTADTTTSTSTTTTYTPTISTIHDGFSLQLTPRLLDDGRILLQYSLSLIGLESLNNTTIGTYTIGLPVTDNRIFVQQSMLRSGSTLVIGGVDRERMTQNRNGVGTPENYFLGGGTSSDSQRFMMFISITPQVMDISEERR